MFGESFLAAPVVKESATKWDVYLPAYKHTPGPYWLDVGSTFQVSRGRRWTRVGGTISSFPCLAMHAVQHD